MISDAEFAAWLNSETRSKCILVEAEYMAGDARGTEYLATLPYISAPTDDVPNMPYLALVKSVPSFTQTMNDLLIGRTTANIGEVVCVGGTTYTDSWLFQRDWIGYPLRLYVGDTDWPKADFRAIWTGVTADFQLDGTNKIVLVARDMQHLLNQPLLTDTVESGPMGGLPAPLLFGTVYNVPAVLLDETTHKYQVNDGPVASISQVRINGISVSFTASAFDGTFTHSTSNPNAQVVADVIGATFGTTPLNNASDLIKYLVTERGYYTIDDLDIDSFNALKTLCPQLLGYFAPAKQVSVYEAIDEICNTVGAFTAITRTGKFYVKRFDFSGDPVMDITASDIVTKGLTLERVLQPVAQIRIGAKKNNATHVQFTGGFGGMSETNQQRLKMRYHANGSAKNEDGLQTYRKMRLLSNPEPPTVNEVEDDGTLPSLFVNGADAAAEAQRRMDLWGVRRYIFGVKCFVSPLTLKLGDAVRISHPRYQLQDGRTGVVVRIAEQLARKRVDLSVIV